LGLSLAGMGYVIAGLVLAFGVLLTIGALTGRVKSQTCCCAADPMNDARMRPYLLADEEELRRASANAEPTS
jgi:hypothetical protein